MGNGTFFLYPRTARIPGVPLDSKFIRETGRHPQTTNTSRSTKCYSENSWKPLHISSISAFETNPCGTEIHYDLNEFQIYATLKVSGVVQTTPPGTFVSSIEDRILN